MEVLSKEGQVTVKIVQSIDELVACQVIRSAAFLGRGEPYAEEFDGNDLVSATHLLARRSGVPIGTMRIRFIKATDGGVVMWERFATLPGERGSIMIINKMADTAIAYARFKGVRTVLGAVEDVRLMRFWSRYGAVLLDVAPARYNDKEYHWMKIPVDVPDLEPVDPDLASKSEPTAFLEMAGIRGDALGRPQ